MMHISIKQNDANTYRDPEVLVSPDWVGGADPCWSGDCLLRDVHHPRPCPGQVPPKVRSEGRIVVWSMLVNDVVKGSRLSVEVRKQHRRPECACGVSPARPPINYIHMTI